MKNKIAKVGLCIFVAGLLFTNSVYGAERAIEYDDVAIVSTNTAFWRKKDKGAAPGNETPEMSPSPSPSANPTGVPKDAPKPAAPKTTPQADAPAETPQASPQASPVAAPKESPKVAPDQTPAESPKAAPKETSDVNTQGNDDEAALARYYQPSGQNQGQPQNQQNPQNQQKQNSNQGQTGGYYHYNNMSGHQKSSQYAPGVGAEIQKILANQPNIQLDPNAYIVQHNDGLWLVMGNIRAKLDILIYVDQKNMREAEFNHGNAIPLYK